MDNFIVEILNGQLTSYQLIFLFILVFLGGIISSLSPCTLGFLPVIVGYVGGYSKNTTSRNVIQISFFVIGLAVVLTSLGILSSVAGKAFGAYSNSILALLVASLILLMGLSLLEVVEIPIPPIVKQMPQNKGNNLIIYPLLLGGAFAFTTTPCSTPILAAIMVYASLKANLLIGGLLLFFYALGQGVILVIAALFTSLFKKINSFKALSGHFMKFSGVILILFSLYIYSKVFGI